MLNFPPLSYSTDYILCTPELEPKLISALKRALSEFSAPSPSSGTTTNSLLASKNFSKIINENHFKRLSKLLDETKGEIVAGGKRDEGERKIEVTLVRNVKPDDSLMSGEFGGNSLSLQLHSREEKLIIGKNLADEIFGPILPIMTMPNKEAMIHFVQRRDTPLVIYVFTQSTKEKDYSMSPPRSPSSRFLADQFREGI